MIITKEHLVEEHLDSEDTVKSEEGSAYQKGVDDTESCLRRLLFEVDCKEVLEELEPDEDRRELMLSMCDEGLDLALSIVETFGVKRCTDIMNDMRRMTLIERLSNLRNEYGDDELIAALITLGMTHIDPEDAERATE